MKLDWLEDLLAVIETGSLNEASRKRFLTQPAFTRRIQSIERFLGVSLFDRSHKPLKLNRSVNRNEEKMRSIIKAVRELETDFKRGESAERILVLGCQHAISTAVAPSLVKSLSGSTNAKIRIRSSNRDECYSSLLTGDIDIALMYQIDNENASPQSKFLDVKIIGEEVFIPVVASDATQALSIESRDDKLDIIGYPENVFLGKVFNQRILPKISEMREINWIAETALTPAALQFAISGIGVAWVPRSLAKDWLMSKKLVDLSDQYPWVSMQICAIQLSKQTDVLIASAWQQIQSSEYT